MYDNYKIALPEENVWIFTNASVNEIYNLLMKMDRTKSAVMTFPVKYWI